MKLKTIKKNMNKPAPRNYRKFETAMIAVIIPAVVLTLQSWGFKNDLVATRSILVVGTLLSAVIKGIGIIIANGEEYIKTDEKDAADDGKASLN